MNDTSSIVEIDHVTQAYRVGFWLKRTEVLSDVSFTIKRNSIFGLLGANGAGKTTLIKLMVGLHRPVNGEVRVMGTPAFFLESKAHLGYLPERPYFNEHLTAEKLLYYMGRLSGMTDSEIDKRIPEVLDLVNMSHARHMELRRYSKGMLQRAGIAQALLHDPELLVFDEPMSGLDPLGRREMRDLMQMLGKNGKTVFFSTHIVQDVEAICEQIAIIEKGKLLGVGSVQDFLGKQTLRTEVFVDTASENKIKNLLKNGEIYEKLPDSGKITLSDERKLNELLGKLLQEGIQIKSVTPVRPSLEDFYKRT